MNGVFSVHNGPKGSDNIARHSFAEKQSTSFILILCSLSFNKFVLRSCQISMISNTSFFMKMVCRYFMLGINLLHTHNFKLCALYIHTHTYIFLYIYEILWVSFLSPYFCFKSLLFHIFFNYISKAPVFRLLTDLNS